MVLSDSAAGSGFSVIRWTSQRLAFSSFAGPPSVDRAAQASGDVDVCGVVVRPGVDCPAVLGQRLKSFETCALPVGGLEDHRDHNGIAAAMPFKGPLEFDSADEFGSEESGGDEQEDDVGFVEPPDDLGSPFLGRERSDRRSSPRCSPHGAVRRGGRGACCAVPRPLVRRRRIPTQPSGGLIARAARREGAHRCFARVLGEARPHAQGPPCPVADLLAPARVSGAVVRGSTDRRHPMAGAMCGGRVVVRERKRRRASS